MGHSTLGDVTGTTAPRQGLRLVGVGVLDWDNHLLQEHLQVRCVMSGRCEGQVSRAEPICKAIWTDGRHESEPVSGMVRYAQVSIRDFLRISVMEVFSNVSRLPSSDTVCSTPGFDSCNPRTPGIMGDPGKVKPTSEDKNTPKYGGL